MNIREHCLTSTRYKRVSNVAFGAIARFIRIPGHQRALCPGDRNAWNSAVLSSQSPVPMVRLPLISFWRPPKVCADSQSSISRSLFTCECQRTLIVSHIGCLQCSRICNLATPSVIVFISLLTLLTSLLVVIDSLLPSVSEQVH